MYLNSKTIPMVIALISIYWLSASCSPELSNQTTTTQKTQTKSSSPPSTQTIQATQDNDEILATVNGVPIFRNDVLIKLKNDSHNSKVTPLRQKNTLEKIINTELVRQKAVELGLKTPAAYVEKIRTMEAQLNGLKRKALSEVFYKSQIVDQAQVTDVDAENYFNQNITRIQTELHIWQLMRKGEQDLAQKELKELRSGIPFEEVAKRKFGKLLPNGRSPWDLGYLNWSQIPLSWQPALKEMKKGDISDIIKGPNKRSWIIKLVDIRQNKNLTYTNAKAAIKKALKKEYIEAQRAKSAKQLKENANIIYYPQNASAPTQLN